MGLCCAVDGCPSYQGDGTERHFFRFPLDETRCKLWLRAVNRPDLKDSSLVTLNRRFRVCDLHFAPSDRLKKYLKQYVVPSLNLPRPKIDDSLSKPTQTEEFKCHKCKSEYDSPSTSKFEVFGTHTSKESTDDRPTKGQLHKECSYESKQMEIMEHQPQQSEDDIPELPDDVQKILNAQKHLICNFKDKQYDREYKMLAVNIYFASPLTYRIFAKTLSLPSKRTLRRTSIDISTNLSEHVIRCLQSKVNNLTETEKICVLCADEMPLKRHLYYQINKDRIIGFHEINGIQKKEPATKAFVVMARGLFSKWEQPLAYCFLNQGNNSPDLSIWLDHIIMQIIDIGLNVVAFTSDQGFNFINIAKDKNVTAANPFFHVNDKKIYYIFDVPHLFKGLRNSMIKYDFIYHDDDGKEVRASWDDVQNLYDIEKEKNNQIAYKLTESHIRPNNNEKNDVKFAAQVLSRCVATAIQYNVELGRLPEKALGTAKFIQLTNDMFDILNSSSCNETYKYKKSFSQEAYQTEVLQNVLKLLKDVRIVQKSNGKSVKNCVKCLKGLEITIQSIMKLSTDMRSQHHEFILTRRLNQDVVGNIFGGIRQKGGDRRKPSPIKFVLAFRKLFLAHLFKHSIFTNQADDLDKLLVAVEDNSNKKPDETTKNGSENLDIFSVPIQNVDYRFEIPDDNTMSYICVYLLRKCKEFHKYCIRMDEYVNNKREVDANVLLINMRAFNSVSVQPFVSLINPKEHFIDYVRKMDEIVSTIFKREEALPSHVGDEILKELDKIVLINKPCECFPIAYLNKLFVRFRIFQLLRQNNRNFSDKSFTNKRFSVSLIGEI